MESITLSDGTVVDVVVLRATPPPEETTFYQVWNVGPPREPIGEFNWEAGRGFSEPHGDNLEQLREVIARLTRSKRHPG